MASLSLLATLMGCSALLIYCAPTSEPSHVHGIAVLLATLAMLDLKGKFEHPA